MAETIDDDWRNNKSGTHQKLKHSEPSQEGRQTPKTEELVGLSVVRLVRAIEECDGVAYAVRRRETAGAGVDLALLTSGIAERIDRIIQRARIAAWALYEANYFAVRTGCVAEKLLGALIEESGQAQRYQRRKQHEKADDSERDFEKVHSAGRVLSRLTTPRSATAERGAVAAKVERRRRLRT